MNLLLIKNKQLLLVFWVLFINHFISAEEVQKNFLDLPITKYKDVSSLIRAGIENETFSQKLSFIIKAIKKRYPSDNLPIMVQAELLDILIPTYSFAFGKEVFRTYGRQEATIEEVLVKFSVMTKTSLEKKTDGTFYLTSDRCNYLREWSNYSYDYDDFIARAFKSIDRVRLHTDKNVLSIKDYAVHSFFYFTRPTDGGIFDLTVKELIKKVDDNDALKVYLAFMLYFSDEENKKKYKATYYTIKKSLKMNSFVSIMINEKESKIKIGDLFSKVENGQITAEELFGGEDDERFLDFF